MTSKRTRVFTYDTTLRDGTQALGVSLSVQDKLLVAEMLDSLSVDYIEGGYPLSNPKDESFFQEVRKLKLRTARIAAFGMTRRRDVQAGKDVGLTALLKSEAPVVTIVGKSWDMQARKVLKVSLDENLAMIADSIKLMARRKRETVFDAEHFFDGWQANPEYALQTLRAAHDAGADWLVLCDTNGGSLPDRIAEAVREACTALPEAKFGIHCHNDCGLAVANSLAAVSAGAVHVQGTVNGIGERCGNADLTTVVANLAIKCGCDVLTEGALAKLTDTSRFVYEVANLNFQESQPFVGAAAFAHKGGMHVHAVRRESRSYEHMNPTVVGNARRILVSELSGVSNIAATVPEKFGLSGDRKAQKRILDRVAQMENEGYQFEAAEASFALLVRRLLGKERRFFDLLGFRVIVEKRGHGGVPVTEATIKIRVGGKEEISASEGDGPVNALDGALRKALDRFYPSVREMHLADYKVRVINPSAATAAAVRVVIESRDKHEIWGTVGVSENLIEASWRALVDSIVYKLSRDEERGRAES